MQHHIHELQGCRPTPLAWYLKAIAILRIVATQADPTARGWWQGDSFRLATTLDRDALLTFFREQWKPTPIVSPWNGGSGFYPKDKGAREALDRILGSTDPRLASYRAAILQAREAVGNLEERPEGEEKAAFLRRLRATWRGDQAAWLRAAVGIDANGEAEFPPLLGSGGNDGRLDFSKIFAETIVDLCVDETPDVRRAAGERLEQALFDVTPCDDVGSGGIGMFLPGGIGAPNGTTGFVSEARVNPWDFAFVIEGSLSFAPGVSRGLAATAGGAMTAPFTLRPTAAGHGSTSAHEESRGEIWMPLWSEPATYRSVQQMLREGRARLRRGGAVDGLGFARAVARLGTARGLSGFERYGFAMRNGKAFLASPLGHWDTRAAPDARLLDALDAGNWLNNVRRAAGVERAPTSFVSAVRNLENALLAVCVRDAGPAAWQRVLVSLARIEDGCLHSPRWAGAENLHLAPVPLLREGWVRVADDGTAVFRLASALAFARTGGVSLRPAWLPMTGTASRLRWSVRDECIVSGADQVARGIDLVTDLLAIGNRIAVRIGRGEIESAGTVPASAGLGASLQDVLDFIDGRVDDDALLWLARGLMACEPPASRTASEPRAGTRVRHPRLDAFALLSLLFQPRSGRDREAEKAPPPDPSVLARLTAGDLRGAGTHAVRRLRASGIHPRLDALHGDARLARRLGAALLLPLDPDVRQILLGHAVSRTDADDSSEETPSL